MSILVHRSLHQIVIVVADLVFEDVQAVLLFGTWLHLSIEMVHTASCFLSLLILTYLPYNNCPCSLM